jgi:hypothetical protein
MSRRSWVVESGEYRYLVKGDFFGLDMAEKPVINSSGIVVTVSS